MPRETRKIQPCPNCSAEFVGEYCHQCGQHVYDYRASLSVLFRDFVGDYFGLDSRLGRTLFALFAKPGRLTLEYIKGRRESYIKPLRLYLVCSVLCLFLISLKLSDASFLQQSGDSADRMRELLAGADSTMFEDRAALHLAVDSLGSAALLPSVQLAINEAEDAMQRGWRDSLDTTRATHPKDALESVFRRARNDAVYRKTAVEGFMRRIPVIMFFFLPIFAIFLKLFYIRRHRLYVEHLVFALHLHAFLFVVIGLAFWIPFIGGGLVALATLAYTFIGLKVVHQQGYIKTFIKMLLIYLTYTIILTIVVSLAAGLYAAYLGASTEGLSIWSMLNFDD